MPDLAAATLSPPVEIPPAVVDDHAAVAAAAITPERAVSACPMPARRLSLSVIASIALHGAAAAAFVWLGLKAPAPISAGKEGIAVEVVVSADTGAASRQDAASGREEAVSSAIDSEARQAVEAPPTQTPPEMAVLDPAPVPTDDPPVAQPDPLTMAERLVDQLPPPPMPETLALAERPVEAAAVETPSPPAPEQVAMPPQPAAPVQVEAPVEASQLAELQTAAPQPVLPPTPAPALRAVTPPPARREAVRLPPTRREAPVTRQPVRPTRQAAATPQPDRPARAARQAESSAAQSERGEGAGQRNRQQSDANGTTGAATTAAVAAWRQRVLAHLARFKVYPDHARDAGIRGRAAVSFTLSASGSVSSVAIATSSGAAVLDQATLAMVRRAQPFPPNPAGSPASFTAGINYSLY
ncbi:TonB family protein [Phreatobacter sp.]|uniref:TonB family protein n=1 Tax=Phreatobacter sp. TaxID=1966341 RepID=UPI0022C1833E|nr:TonB family protein [Phreatobacter sp.]MCZ8315299.1 TonB family protein [Phreatobacter sp.]